MRMRARLTNAPTLQKVCQAVEKLSKTCLLRLTKEKIYFIAPVTSSIDTGIRMYANVQADGVFEHYRIDSANKDEIGLVVYLEHFGRALKSTQGALETTIKLAKKENIPILKFDITGISKTGRSQKIVQEMPVEVLAAADLNALVASEPATPSIDVHILLPPLAKLRKIAERLKNMSTYLNVCANMEGQMEVGIETDTVQVTTFFEDLGHPTLNKDMVDASQIPSLVREDTSAMSSTRVDMRDFIKFVQAHHVQPINIVCCIIENAGLVLYVYIGDMRQAEYSRGNLGVLSYYIPSVSR